MLYVLNVFVLTNKRIMNFKLTKQIKQLFFNYLFVLFSVLYFKKYTLKAIKHIISFTFIDP